MSDNTYLDAALNIEQRISNLLSQMTLEEKVAQLGSANVYELMRQGQFDKEKASARIPLGIGQITRIGGQAKLSPEESAKLYNTIQQWTLENTRLKIPVMVHEESCSGYMAAGATVFPQAIGVASTFSTELTKRLAEVIRVQMRSVGGHHALAPLLDVTRDPRWGRTEETFGEDPCLTATIGGAYISGLQGDSFAEGVLATGKHFVGYGASEGGMNWAPVHLSDRQLKEVYLYPFEAAVKKNRLASIMPAYHELDGVPMHSHTELLKGILRNQWGFDGLLVSDYHGIESLHDYHKMASDKHLAASNALKAGIDVELPTANYYSDILIQAIQSGILDITLVDESVSRILRYKFELGLFEQPYVDTNAVLQNYNTPEQRALAREIARDSMVLLKNDGILPLPKAGKKIALIGPSADSLRNLLGDYVNYCHLESLIDIMEGGGAVEGEPVPDTLEKGEVSDVIDMISIKAAMEKVLGSDVPYAQGCEINSLDESGFSEAIELAKQSDVAVMVMGERSGLITNCTSGEARDRTSLDLPGVQRKLVEQVIATGTPVVVVLVSGRPNSIGWMDQSANAILEAWLPGQEGSGAICDLLFGNTSPSGKLPISVPRDVGQIPVYYSHKPSGQRSHWKVDYVEMPATPLYPFGYGLSYTSFEYSGMEISKSQAHVGESINISMNVSNVGHVAGEEIVQLYISDLLGDVTRPVKELKGFARVALQPGEKRKVVFHLAINQLGFYNSKMKFVVEPGIFSVMIGASSDDIRLTGEFEVIGEVTDIEDSKIFTCEVNII